MSAVKAFNSVAVPRGAGARGFATLFKPKLTGPRTARTQSPHYSALASRPLPTEANSNATFVQPTVQVPAIEKAHRSKTPERGERGYAAHLSDSEVIRELAAGKVKFFNIEAAVNDNERAVRIRRRYVAERTQTKAVTKDLPYENYNYDLVAGQCCENVIGYIPLPVGVVGPIIVDGAEYFLPMATSEGALIASCTRGAKALSENGGVSTYIARNGMSRAPVLGAPDAKTAFALKEYFEKEFDTVAAAFNATSGFARLISITTRVAGRKVFVRFTSTTGDAMGMNMVGKGTEQALNVALKNFPSVHVISLSGNVCTDKKPSAVNWVEGRGKSVVADAIIKKDTVEKVLKTTVAALVDLNYVKNFMGSAVAGSIGGNNAHASNMVTAMFLATGQDAAQNVESSNCMTTMEATTDENGEEALYMSVTMPSLEVGTVGGGTTLPGQKSMLAMLGVAGAHPTNPGANSDKLARLVASGVMAGELSLMAALSAGHLIKSHMALNRNTANKKH